MYVSIVLFIVNDAVFIYMNICVRICSVNGKEPLVTLGYVLAYVQDLSGIKYGQDLWSKMPMHTGMCLESCLGQRAIAKKTFDAWDDVIRPDRIIICDDWPITLKWDAAFSI
jgi:hypothetical protein